MRWAGEAFRSHIFLTWLPAGVQLSLVLCRPLATRSAMCLRRLFPSSMTSWPRFSQTGMSHLTFISTKRSSGPLSGSCSWSCVMKTFKTRSVWHGLRHPVLQDWHLGREKQALCSGSHAVFPSSWQSEVKQFSQDPLEIDGIETQTYRIWLHWWIAYRPHYWSYSPCLMGDKWKKANPVTSQVTHW